MPFGDLQFASVETEKVVTALAAAIIGLGLNEGAYLAEITAQVWNPSTSARLKQPKPWA